MKNLFNYLISIYQKFFSLDTGNIPRFFGFSKKTCMFYPTCSEYAKQAIQKYGVFHGIRLFLLRVRRCHPWNTPSIDELI